MIKLCMTIGLRWNLKKPLAYAANVRDVRQDHKVGNRPFKAQGRSETRGYKLVANPCWRALRFILSFEWQITNLMILCGLSLSMARARSSLVAFMDSIKGCRSVNRRYKLPPPPLIWRGAMVEEAATSSRALLFECAASCVAALVRDVGACRLVCSANA